MNITDINIKNYGLYFFIYLIIILILIFNGFVKQAIMITLLTGFYIYYKKYYSGINEFIDYSKNELQNNIIKKINTIKNSDNNNIYNNSSDFETNIIDEGKYIFDKIQDKIQVLNNKCQEFIINNVPDIERPELQATQENLKETKKNEINELTKKYNSLAEIFLSNNVEQNNIFQQIKNTENEIINIIHNIIFINHKAIKDIDKFIGKEMKPTFNFVNQQLFNINQKTEVNKYSEYIPENGFDINSANSMNNSTLY